jgi:hypothetical protein
MTVQEIEDLKKRVEQLEKALLAVAFNQPTCCDERGRLIAMPRAADPGQALVEPHD